MKSQRCTGFRQFFICSSPDDVSFFVTRPSFMPESNASQRHSALQHRREEGFFVTRKTWVDMTSVLAWFRRKILGVNLLVCLLQGWSKRPWLRLASSWPVVLCRSAGHNPRLTVPPGLAPMTRHMPTNVQPSSRLACFWTNLLGISMKSPSIFSCRIQVAHVNQLLDAEFTPCRPCTLCLLLAQFVSDLGGRSCIAKLT